MRLSKSFLLAAAVSVTLAGLLASASARGKPDSRVLYVEFCKPCHQADSPHGEYTPMSLIQDQWTTFFEVRFEKTHEGLTLPGSDRPLLRSLDPGELKSLRKFAFDHAADSEQPMSCEEPPD